MRVQIVIPIFRLNEHRLRALDVVLDSVAKSRADVMLIEQSNAEGTKAKEIFDRYARRPGMRYVRFPYDGPEKIRKAAMMNWAALETRPDYIWIVDADTLLSWDSVLDAIESTHAQAYNPAGFFARLSQTQALALYESRKQTIHRSTHRIIVQPFSPNSLVVRADAFFSVGGFDERFVGYGWEDVDFIIRLLGSGVRYIQLGGVGIHMWHPKEREVRGSFDLLVQNNAAVFKDLERADWIQVIQALCAKAILPLEGPDAATMLRSLADATGTWLADGCRIADEATRGHRKSVCQQCAWWAPPELANLYMGRCKKCGCAGAKLFHAKQECPLGRW